MITDLDARAAPHVSGRWKRYKRGLHSPCLSSLRLPNAPRKHTFASQHHHHHLYNVHQRRRPRQRRQLRPEQLQLRRRLPVQAQRVQVLNALPFDPVALVVPVPPPRQDVGKHGQLSLSTSCNSLAMGARGKKQLLYHHWKQ